ncbi:MAG: hypothetical protein AB7J34_16330 [Limisphaerales bacterium]
MKQPIANSPLGWLRAVSLAALAFLLQAAFAPATAQAAASSSATTASVSVEKVVPSEVLVGRSFEIVIRVTNLGEGELQDVTLTDTTEGGARVEDATPKADQVDGKQSTWRLGNLGNRQTREVRVRAVATDETPITGCAVATFRPSACATTRVVRPAIELTKSMPAEALLCDPVPVKLVVRNSGTSALNDVRITDNLPEGLSTDSGESKRTFEVGRLNPGESREVGFGSKASRTGRFVNTASVTSAEGAEASAEAAINILQPVLTVACQTPPARTLQGIPEPFVQFLGRPFEVCWEVGNSGNAPSANSRLDVVVPAGVEVRSATEGGSASGGRIAWNLGPIAPGGTKKVCATLVAARAGTYAFQASANGACAAPVETACSVRIQGVNAVLVELVDDPDPIQVGENTTYTVRDTHQGGGLDLLDVAVRVVFPDGMEPTAASNAGQVQGKTVTWAPVASLPLRQSLAYTVTGKGTAAGDHRLEVLVTTRGRQTPITEFESTTVY